MKTTNLLSLISTALVALSQPTWAGGGGFHGGGFGGGLRGGGVGFGSPRFGGGGFRAAPYRYGGTHFAGRSLGGPSGAFRYYNGGTRTSAARQYKLSGRETNR